MEDHPSYQNFILQAQASQYSWSGESFLSIKSFYHGAAHYRIGKRHYEIGETDYLVLNECTHYEMEIDSRQATQSFCLFFDPAFVQKVGAAILASEEKCLDFAFPNENGVSFLERKYRQEGEVSKLLLLANQQMTWRKDDLLWQEQLFHQLLKALFFQNHRAIKEANQLYFAKAATREEIYRRLYFAKDYMDANFTASLSLEDIAAVAQLSSNHFLRTFKQLFRTSPSQYIAHLRMQKACQLLQNSNESISTIVYTAGYSSLSNFSWEFKKYFGLSPSDYRKKVIHRK